MRGGGRGRRGPAPPDGAASRGIALAGLLAAVAGLVSLTSLSTRPAPEPGRAPPFDPGPLWGLDPEGRRVPAMASPRTVLLYVDEACPFCREEVAAWARIVGTRGAASGPTVIVSARSVDAARAAFPDLDHLSWYRDADGSIARALGVTAVPFQAVTDGAGTVVRVVLGRTSDARRRRIAELLYQPPKRRKP